MKIVDRTPFFDENGQLTLVNRAKAIMQFGFGWSGEMEAQKDIIAVFSKILDKNFTLLRNIIPPGLDVTIPFILVGPTGVFVMYVTPARGMFRAKGDEWGSLTGGTYKAEKPNLLTRTDRMAHAIQVYLQRQGYSEITTVEPILLCSDPSVTVDSLRPIIRVVMRDALERFAVSISQARVILTPESVHNLVNRILNPATTPPNPETGLPPEEMPGAPAEAAQADSGSGAFPAQAETGAASSLSQFSQGEGILVEPPPARRRINRKQWIMLIVLFVIWLLIMAVFVFIVAKDLIL